MLVPHNNISLGVVLKKVPQVPFAGVSYLGQQTTVTNENTTTFTEVDIGTPHPDRIIILAVYLGVNAAVSGTVNGYGEVVNVRASEFAILAFNVETGNTATITITATSSARKAVGVYVAYVDNPVPLDFGSASTTTTTDATVSNIKAMNGGFLVYCGGENAALGDFTTTWNGTNGTLVEDVDAQLESTGSYTFGHINFTRSSDIDDLTMAESTSGTKRLVVVSWSAPTSYLIG